MAVIIHGMAYSHGNMVLRIVHNNILIKYGPAAACIHNFAFEASRWLIAHIVPFAFVHYARPSSPFRSLHLWPACLSLETCIGIYST